ncbi:Nuclear pore complex protein GP210 [Linum perenne]
MVALITTLVALALLSGPPSPSVSAPATGSGNDAGAGAGTPDRGTPSGLTEHSPRTPQPYIEYVRRTIDETPFYRRDGRRRFNTQNTY